MHYYSVMNKILRPLIIGIALVLLAATQMVMAQTKAIKEVNAKPTMAYTGAQLFHEFCAVCHGGDARGAGPAADALKVKPTDLTLLTKQNKGKFPAGQVQDVIVGTEFVAAHGTKEMPMWGDIFRSISPNQAFTDLRITNLVLYVQSLQR
jgi:mono/diheme cytochrome c family protein